MQRRLHRGQAEIHDIADFAQGAAEHIHQDHAGALGERKPHEGAQAGAGDLAAQDVIGRVGNHVHLLAQLECLLAVALAQKIQRGVVRDPEQPSPRVADCAGGCERLHRLDQRILQHVLAVDHRADHARAIAMQFRPHLGEQAVNACSGERWIWRRFHSAS